MVNDQVRNAEQFIDILLTGYRIAMRAGSVAAWHEQAADRFLHCGAH
jgi:hypothetical protein